LVSSLVKADLLPLLCKILNLLAELLSCILNLLGGIVGEVLKIVVSLLDEVLIKVLCDLEITSLLDILGIQL
jgi:hypothetical protein